MAHSFLGYDSGAVRKTQAGQPLGYVDIDSNGYANFESIILRSGLSATIAAVLLKSGEAAYCTDTGQDLFGDGTTTGGAYRGLSSDSFVIAQAARTPTQSGTRLLAAYEAAKALTPAGAALSATNRAKVLLLPGTQYTLPSTLTLQTSFVDLEGLSRGPKPIIVQTTASSFLFIAGNLSSPIDLILRNIEFRDAGASPTCTFITGGFTALLCEDLYFNRSSGSVMSMSGNATLTVTARRCESPVGGTSLFPGGAAVLYSSSSIFEDCRGGSSSFGGATSEAVSPSMPATLIRCVNHSTSSWLFKPSGLLYLCRSKCAINRLVSTAKFIGCDFDPSSGAALNNNSVGVAINARGCRSSGSLLGTNVTNTWTGDETLGAGYLTI